MTRLAFLGNFDPPYSTENQWRHAFEQHGVEVICAQQNALDPRQWERIASEADAACCATTWGWPTPASEPMWHRITGRGVRTFSVHLDLLWGLPREQLVYDRHPQFAGPQIVWTADGDHDAQWAGEGIDHRWLIPAVDERMLGRGRPRVDYRACVAFVGSRGYHPEWAWRETLVAALHDRYRDTFRHWGGGGEPSVRGPELADLYASVDVIVGDACFADQASRYWSDRIPETLARGGFMVHPAIPGAQGRYASAMGWFAPCDLDALFDEVDWWLELPDARRTVTDYALEHVAGRDTWTHRAGEILATLGLAGEVAA